MSSNSAPPFIGEEIEQALDWRSAVAAIADGHQRPRAIVSDILTPARGGELLVRAARIDGLGSGVKAVTIMPENPKRATPAPSVQGAFMLFAEEGGDLEAIIDGAVLTRWKTVADSLCAAERLIAIPPRTLFVMGAGAIAAACIQGYSAVFPTLEEIVIWARDGGKSAALTDQLREFKIDARASDRPDIAAGSADIICTATGAVAPILKGKWLSSPCFVDLIGAHAPHMREADDDLITDADLFVDCRDTAIADIGELAIPISRDVIEPASVRADHYDMAGSNFKTPASNRIIAFKNGGGAHLDLMISRYLFETYASITSRNEIDTPSAD